MIIHIKKSTLFTVDPDIRFSKEYGLPLGTLKALYRRHKMLGYSTNDLCEFYKINTGKETSKKSIKRWMWRTEVYAMTLPIINKGVETVVSSFFKDHEWKVIKEITKNIQSSVQGNTKTLI